MTDALVDKALGPDVSPPGSATETNGDAWWGAIGVALKRICCPDCGRLYAEVRVNARVDFFEVQPRPCRDCEVAFMKQARENGWTVHNSETGETIGPAD